MTIDSNIGGRLAAIIAVASHEYPDATWHTLTAMTNGQHGGVEVVLDGDMPDGEEVRRCVVIH